MESSESMPCSAFDSTGTPSTGNAVFDVLVMSVFGVLGYLMRKFGYEASPMVLAFVLGPMLENNLRKSLILSQGSFDIFWSRPITATCLAFALAILLVPLLPSLSKKREAIALDTA